MSPITTPNPHDDQQDQADESGQVDMLLTEIDHIAIAVHDLPAGDSGVGAHAPLQGAGSPRRLPHAALAKKVRLMKFRVGTGVPR